MKKIMFLIMITVILLLSRPAYAYWASDIIDNQITTNPIIQIGDWEYPAEEPAEVILIDAAANPGPLSKGTPFLYNGLVYTVKADGFDTRWHQPDAIWAVASLELEWQTGRNYMGTSVVKYNGKYYKANENYASGWYAHNPETSQGFGTGNALPWFKIEAMEASMFYYIPGTSIRDYSNPKTEYIVYK